MPVTSVTKDPEALTITVVADFAAPLRRVWDAYLDPRQLERFWGPPGWPATFTRHDGSPGGKSDYYMSGPDGQQSWGYWEWLAVDELKTFEVGDGFADENKTVKDELPSMRMRFVFEATGEGCRVSTTTHFESLADLQQVLAVGMEEGMRAAMAQIDAVLADLSAFAAGSGTTTQLLSDTQVRISRIINGDLATVWRAHHDRTLLQRWLLGPDGWTMPVCEVATTVGDTYRYEWASAEGEARFGFTGELLASTPENRTVTTERMIDTPGPTTQNELTFTAVEGGTLLSLLITYPSVEVRDMILATGMTDGMEISYQRMETLL